MYGISGVKIKCFHAPNQAVWTRSDISIRNLDKERGREGQKRGRGEERKGESTAIPVSFSVALEGIDRLYFITFPGKDITKNFRIHFLRMVCN